MVSVIITGAGDGNEASEAKCGDVTGAVSASGAQWIGGCGVLPKGRDQRGIIPPLARGVGGAKEG